MRIVMMTNTYLPHVGGVARSVQTFSEGLRQAGHHVLIVAPDYPGHDDGDAGDEAAAEVLRVPAVQNFNGTDFSVRLPIPGLVAHALSEFRPDLIHAHHPFLLGDTAQRVAAQLNLPLVFTHHTMYEQYTHYVPGDSLAMQRFVVELATHFANLCHAVIAPSESIADVLHERGVHVPIHALPTGIDGNRFARGQRQALRRELQLPESAYVVGHVGRLAPEKNLTFLAHAVARFLRHRANAHFVVVGSGPCEQNLREVCERAGVERRLHLLGTRTGQPLIDAYAAMDVFVFASTSETQGMVLAESMAAGVPVVALDGPGVREVVRDFINGRLLSKPEIRRFVDALQWMASHPDRQQLRTAARQTATSFAMERCTQRLVEIYGRVLKEPAPTSSQTETATAWESAMRLLETEYQLWSNRAAAASTAISESSWWMTRLLRRGRRAWHHLLEKAHLRGRRSTLVLSPTDGTVQRRRPG